jgi:hypothetical protein
MSLTQDDEMIEAFTPDSATSNASTDESRPDANERASLDG